MNETNPNGGELELSREVEAIQIPSGDTFKLPAGTKVILTQSLGGTYTVATDQGLARISEQDSDALGLEEVKTEQPATEKVNSDIGNPDNCKLDTIDEGPGTDVTLILFAIQYF